MSDRDLPSELSEEIVKPALRPFLAIHIDLPDPVFAFTGKGTITVGTDQYLGIEGVASIDAVTESIDGSATGSKAMLHRIPSEFRDDLADQAVRGSLYEIIIGVFDEAYQSVKAFKTIWKGTLQSYEIIDGGDDLSVTVGGESRSIDQRRPAIKRFTDEYQQRKYAGDVFFEYVPQMAETPILWAQARQDSL